MGRRSSRSSAQAEGRYGEPSRAQSMVKTVASVQGKTKWVKKGVFSCFSACCAKSVLRPKLGSPKKSCDSLGNLILFSVIMKFAGPGPRQQCRKPLFLLLSFPKTIKNHCVFYVFKIPFRAAGLGGAATRVVGLLPAWGCLPDAPAAPAVY